MDAQTTLSTIAEVAIALAGFTGVVAVLGNRRKNDWTSEERLQLRVLVETSMTALFASFTPGVLYLTNMLAYMVRARNAQPTLGQRLLLPVGIATVLAHFLAAAGIMPWYIAIFVIGLLQQVFIAAYNFVLLLFPLRDTA